MSGVVKLAKSVWMELEADFSAAGRIKRSSFKVDNANSNATASIQH